MTKQRFIPVGELVGGTLDALERIEALLPYARLFEPFDEAVITAQQVLDDSDEEAAPEALDDLIAVAENHVAPYCYIGNHPGDGACFGVWVDVDAVEQAVLDRELPAFKDYPDEPGFQGLWLQVNERGNMTLYNLEGGVEGPVRNRELWAIV